MIQYCMKSGPEMNYTDNDNSSNRHTPGILYIVSTPIGNLKDITHRAEEILRTVDLIVAEDTRHTRILLNTYNISTQMISYHEHNAQRVLPQVMEHLQNGLHIAQVSDAGTPGISDPGYRLIQAAIAERVEVVPIPGASAVLSAIVPSGLPLDRFVFEGFLPRKKGRKTRMDLLATESRTMVFYESPHRLVKTLIEFSEVFGNDRKAVVCRELTKKFEEFKRGTMQELVNHYTAANPKGEIVIIVEGIGKKAAKKRVDFQ